VRRSAEREVGGGDSDLNALPPADLRGLTDEEVWDQLHGSMAGSALYERAVLELHTRISEKQLEAAHENAVAGTRLAKLTKTLVLATWALVGVTAVLALITALPLLSPPAARLDRVWLLWGENYRMDQGEVSGQPYISHATSSEQECRMRLRRELQQVAHASTSAETTISTENDTAMIRLDKMVRVDKYYCLPDTIDPRWPKGR
jgi:hypothetical protein